MLHFLTKASHPLMDELLAKVSASVVGLSATVIFLGWTHEASFYFSKGAIELPYLSLFDWPYSLANWLEPLLLAGAALLFSVVALLNRNQIEGQSGRWSALAWLFAFLSFDEAVNSHEMILKPLRSLVGSEHVALWMLPAFFVAGSLCIYEIPVLNAVPRNYRIRLVVSAALFVTGSLVIEYASQSVSAQFGSSSEVYRITASVEETLEIIGAALLCCTLIKYIRHFAMNEAFPVFYDIPSELKNL